jgi:hypothetical protein
VSIHESVVFDGGLDPSRSAEDCIADFGAKWRDPSDRVRLHQFLLRQQSQTKISSGK